MALVSAFVLESEAGRQEDPEASITWGVGLLHAGDKGFPQCTRRRGWQQGEMAWTVGAQLVQTTQLG